MTKLHNVAGNFSPFINMKSLTCFISRSRRLIMYDESMRAETAPPALKAFSSPTKPEMA